MRSARGALAIMVAGLGIEPADLKALHSPGPLVAAAQVHIYRDLRACRREMDTLRKQAAKRRKMG